MSVIKIQTNENIWKDYSSEDNKNKINKIISVYKIHIYRKKIKKLIEKNKNCFTIISTLKEQNLHLIVYFPEQVKEYDVIYEPILRQNIVFIPKEDCHKKLSLKFHFVNSKNESIIDPKYNNEFSDNMFLNIINLKKILEKEEERKEDFKAFLETYFTSNKLSKAIRQYFFGSTQNLRKINKRKTITLKSALKLKKIGNKIKSENNLLSILKTRNKNRVPSGKKISFGNVTKLEYYK